MCCCEYTIPINNFNHHVRFIKPLCGFERIHNCLRVLAENKIILYIASLSIHHLYRNCKFSHEFHTLVPPVCFVTASRSYAILQSKQLHFLCVPKERRYFPQLFTNNFFFCKVDTRIDTSMNPTILTFSSQLLSSAFSV